MASDMDFNGADTQDAAFDLIPANTLVRVTLTTRPGGAGPEGWLTQSKTSPALYLNTEAIIMEGPFARRRIYTRIGFRGKNAGSGDDSYGNRGRALSCAWRKCAKCAYLTNKGGFCMGPMNSYRTARFAAGCWPCPNRPKCPHDRPVHRLCRRPSRTDRARRIRVGAACAAAVGCCFDA